MFNKFRKSQYSLYNQARTHFLQHYNQLINIEKFVSTKIDEIINKNLQQIVNDFNEASNLYPFWQNYPPDNRGRAPIGDQYPWIEVGEHTIGEKLPRLLEPYFHIRDMGLPSGTDVRLVLTNAEINKLTNRLTDTCWLFLDIKSVGPRDDQNHAVMSPNQISGNGRWDAEDNGVVNDVIVAKGKRKSQDFYCSIPPIYVLSDGTILPVIILIVKPVYRMLSLEENSKDGGQPLGRISLASVPNGILLQENPNYLQQYPNLFFPGKDDQSTNPLKKRCRISFDVLKSIEAWRFKEIVLP